MGIMLELKGMIDDLHHPRGFGVAFETSDSPLRIKIKRISTWKPESSLVFYILMPIALDLISGEGSRDIHCNKNTISRHHHS
ncbi:hypothetical protein GUJ93_ZPchr0008g11844 [Zizania palustris]|uniref:Uncharacterized protein n=1 Tax=Zizania palustris TaxID=103762 RepID=A0A8J5RUF2_ZIZPA|nr:hypothetical protein GUJ93_ZPchr0008g11844 [Zizania palustris]